MDTILIVCGAIALAGAVLAVPYLPGNAARTKPVSPGGDAAQARVRDVRSRQRT